MGLVSQRDVQLLETMRDVDPEEVKVSEAMGQEAFAVSPNTPLREVAATMAAHKYGSAVVMEHDRVIGVFTTVDALHALSSLLEDLRD
jgi:acetoin utilization protein AcuB